MRLKRYCAVLILTTASLLSCKKEPKYTIPEVVKYGRVNFGNGDIPTMVIGDQEWTVIEYNDLQTQEDAFGKLPLPGGWRIPSVYDFNKLTANVSTKTDVAGNYYADAGDDLQRFFKPNQDDASNAFHFNAEPRGYILQYVAYNQDSFETNSSCYYLTSNRGAGLAPNNHLLYRLNKSFAGIVRVKSDNPIAKIRASLRFVKDVK